jgi:hypothetical protein
MYIQQLQSWDNGDWDRYFLSYNIVDPNERCLIKNILIRDKQYIEQNFDTLRDFGIIN